VSQLLLVMVPPIIDTTELHRVVVSTLPEVTHSTFEASGVPVERIATPRVLRMCGETEGRRIVRWQKEEKGGERL
jgi:hypothetical protein